MKVKIVQIGKGDRLYPYRKKFIGQVVDADRDAPLNRLSPMTLMNVKVNGSAGAFTFESVMICTQS